MMRFNNPACFPQHVNKFETSQTQTSNVIITVASYLKGSAFKQFYSVLSLTIIFTRIYSKVN